MKLVPQPGHKSLNSVAQRSAFPVLAAQELLQNRAFPCLAALLMSLFSFLHITLHRLHCTSVRAISGSSHAIASFCLLFFSLNIGPGGSRTRVQNISHLTAFVALTHAQSHRFPDYLVSGGSLRNHLLLPETTQQYGGLIKQSRKASSVRLEPCALRALEVPDLYSRCGCNGGKVNSVVSICILGP